MEITKLNQAFEEYTRQFQEIQNASSPDSLDTLFHLTFDVQFLYVQYQQRSEQDDQKKLAEVKSFSHQVSDFFVERCAACQTKPFPDLKAIYVEFLDSYQTWNDLFQETQEQEILETMVSQLTDLKTQLRDQMCDLSFSVLESPEYDNIKKLYENIESLEHRSIHRLKPNKELWIPNSSESYMHLIENIGSFIQLISYNEDFSVDVLGNIKMQFEDYKSQLSNYFEDPMCATGATNFFHMLDDMYAEMFPHSLSALPTETNPSELSESIRDCINYPKLETAVSEWFIQPAINTRIVFLDIHGLAESEDVDIAKRISSLMKCFLLSRNPKILSGFFIFLLKDEYFFTKDELQAGNQNSTKFLEFFETELRALEKYSQENLSTRNTENLLVCTEQDKEWSLLTQSFSPTIRHTLLRKHPFYVGTQQPLWQHLRSVAMWMEGISLEAFDVKKSLAFIQKELTSTPDPIENPEAIDHEKLADHIAAWIQESMPNSAPMRSYPPVLKNRESSCYYHCAAQLYLNQKTVRDALDRLDLSQIETIYVQEKHEYILIQDKQGKLTVEQQTQLEKIEKKQACHQIAAFYLQRASRLFEDHIDETSSHNIQDQKIQEALESFRTACYWGALWNANYTTHYNVDANSTTLGLIAHLRTFLQKVRKDCSSSFMWPEDVFEQDLKALERDYANKTHRDHVGEPIGRQQDAEEVLLWIHQLISLVLKDCCVRHESLEGLDEETQQVVATESKGQETLHALYVTPKEVSLQQLLDEQSVVRSRIEGFSKEFPNGVHAHRVDQVQTLSILSPQHAPQILQVSCTRFLAGNNQVLERIDKEVQIDPTSKVQLSFWDQSQEKCVQISYKVVGCILHMGATPHVGHYRVFVPVGDTHMALLDDLHTEPIFFSLHDPLLHSMMGQAKNFMLEKV